MRLILYKQTCFSTSHSYLTLKYFLNILSSYLKCSRFCGLKQILGIIISSVLSSALNCLIIYSIQIYLPGFKTLTLLNTDVF